MIEESVSSTVMFTFPASAKFGWPRREKLRARKSVQNVDLLIQIIRLGIVQPRNVYSQHLWGSKKKGHQEKKARIQVARGQSHHTGERKERNENKHEDTLIPYFIRV
jgi:hypothetical protein